MYCYNFYYGMRFESDKERVTDTSNSKAQDNLTVEGTNRVILILMKR